MSAPLRYEAGAVRSTAPHLTVLNLQIGAGPSTATIQRMAAQAEARIGADGLDVTLTDITVASAAAHNEERALQAAGIELGGSIVAKVPATGPATVQAKVRASSGEVLWERAYLNLGEFPVDVSTSLESGADGVRFGESALDVAKLGRAQGTASFNSAFELTRAQADVSFPSMSTAFEKLVGDTFADALPFLGGTDVGGALHATIDYRKTAGGTRATGRIGVRNGSIAVAAPAVKLDHYELDLPFDLATGSAAGPSITGSLRTQPFEVAGMSVAAVDLPLVARNNELAVAQPLAVSFGGGTLRGENLRAFDLTSGAPAGDVRVALEGMSLEALGKTLGWPALRGNLAGDLGLVSLRDGRVTTSGALALDVFGGKVALSGITVEEIFSPVPSLKLDVEATDVDLRQATESLGVGYVSGVGRAKIDDLEFAAGQPMRFDAEFETVPTRGVPQRVSVAAIQQLTILGGAGADALTRSVLNLFDEYRYAKMGFRCSLRNDRFILHGIEEHDGKDFLVVGTLLPPSVNVISHNQVIAFGEMVERLQRISAVSP